MTNSAQISKPVSKRLKKPAAAQSLAAIRLAAALPPGAQPLADPLSDKSFLEPFADLLAAEAYDFHRQARFRAAAFNLEYEEQSGECSYLNQNLDLPTRQYLAAHALSAHPTSTLFSDESHRSFRRTLQTHQAILCASRLGL